MSRSNQSNTLKPIPIPKEAVQHLLDPARGGSFKKVATGVTTGLFGASVGITAVAKLFENSPKLSEMALKFATGGSFVDAKKFVKQHPNHARQMLKSKAHLGGGWFADKDGLTIAGVSMAGLGAGAVAGAAAMVNSALTKPAVAQHLFDLATDAAGAGFAGTSGIKGFSQKLHQMDQHAWEYIREGASQILGRKPSKHWPKLKHAKMKHDRRHYETITKLQTPQLAAKMIHADPEAGAGFADTIAHVQNYAIDNYETVEKFLQPFFKRKELIKLIPIIGPGAKQLLTAAEQGIEFVKFLKTLRAKGPGSSSQDQSSFGKKNLVQVVSNLASKLPSLRLQSIEEEEKAAELETIS